MTDPNVQTQPDGSTVVLEPGDPGYVDPTLPPEGEGPPPPPESGVVLSPDLPVPQAEGDPPAPPPQDLRLKSAEGQDDSEAIIMNRGTVVESTHPTDLVPNTPQIRPFPIETVEEPVDEPVAEEEPPAEEPAP